jgi:hypothetical protein
MIPKDYKRTYQTMDGVNVAPDDEIWVATMNVDTYAWEPEAMTAKAAEDKQKRFYWSTYEQCQEYCQDINEEE